MQTLFDNSTLQRLELRTERYYINITSVRSLSFGTRSYHTIIVSEFYLAYHQDVVQVFCLPAIILNLLMNSFVHLYLPFYVVFISLKTLYLSITFILMYILEARCTHTGYPYCNNIVLHFLPYFYNYFNHLFNFI